MANIKLYKDNKLVLDKDGNKVNDLYTFDNITYAKEKNILTREDENFCFYLDFNNETSKITIKENNYELNINLEVKEKKLSTKKHEIVYNIQSEENIENKVQITF